MTSTEPLACRAIRPVSRVTVWPPYWNVLHQRVIDTYFSTYSGYYFTGDGASRDEDGYYWITGRVDDVINVSGHRMGIAEVESALMLHEQIAEAAVVGFPHDIKGQGIYAYVTPMQGVEPSEELRAELIQLCVKEIGPIAKPDVIQWAPGSPACLGETGFNLQATPPQASAPAASTAS